MPPGDAPPHAGRPGLPVVVVGGGITGLAAAWTLVRDGARVLLLEASTRWGGALRSERTPDGFLLEWGPCTVRGTPELLDLARRSGTLHLLERAAPISARRYLANGGRLRRVPPAPGRLLAVGLLGPRGALRLLAEPLLPRRDIPGESVRQFGLRRLGRRATAQLLEPYVIGLWAGDPGELGYAATLPDLRSLEMEHGGLVRGLVARAWRGRGGRRARARLLSSRQGVEHWGRQVAEALDRARPGVLRPGCLVERISPDAEGFLVQTDTGPLRAAAVLVTLPLEQAAALLPRHLATQLRSGGIPVRASVVVQHWLFPRAPERDLPPGMGVLFPAGEGAPALGILTPGHLFGGRTPPGGQLWTAYLGGRAAPRWLTLTREERVAAMRSYLGRLLRRPPEPQRIEERVLHDCLCQYGTAHGEVLAASRRLEEHCPGLVLAGDWQLGFAVPDRVRAGVAAAARLLDRRRLPEGTGRC